MRPGLLALLLTTFVAAGTTAAADWEATGFIGLDAQAFWLDGQHEGQNNGLNPSLVLQPEFYWRNASGNQRITVVGFIRADSADNERSHGDLREAYWGFDGDGWGVTLGFGKVFWGVAESRHLVDIINQTDLVESIDEESKLGQPMVSLSLQRDYGEFSFYALPYFRERTFPGTDGRLRGPLAIDTDSPVYESGAEERHVDLALRYSHYFGDVDVGLHVFEGTSREARFDIAPSGECLLPIYDQMTQVGLDLQYTNEAWLWKLEAITRDTRIDTFMAAVGGFEYTIYGVRDSSADVGLLLEYQYDGRNDRSPVTVAQNDLFAGMRLALNDAEDTSVLAGIAVDLDSSELFLNIEAERRFGDNLDVELQLRSFLNAEPGTLLGAVDQDDYIQLRLNWYY